MKSSKVCEPTIRGEIKKARTGNYDCASCVFEFIDNALDAGAQQIRIEIRERSGSGIPHKILISDDSDKGINEETVWSIFSWTYERTRREADIGEYGAGFKTASVNLCEKLTLMTTDGVERFFQAVADWQDMAIDDRWHPQVMEIKNEYYSDVHPFSRGSSFIMEGLRNEMFSISSSDTGWTRTGAVIDRLYHEIAYHYRYLLHKNPRLRITVRGVWRTTEGVMEKDCREWGRPDPMPAGQSAVQSTISVYKDSNQFFRVYFRGGGSDKWEKVEYVDRYKNGNSILRCLTAPLGEFDSMHIVDTIVFKSMHHNDLSESIELMTLYPTCTLDIVRDERVVGRDLSLRAPRADPFSFFVKHEVHYRSYALNALLGVHYNKQSSALRENDLRYTMEYIQQLHEKEFVKMDKQRAAAVTPVVVVTTPPLPLTVEQQQPPLPPPPPSRRKNFSITTKIQTLQRQECRDSILDFVLGDKVLLMEYDHKSGVPANNSDDNCQALSVITHAIKTRFPNVMEEIESSGEARERYIVDLLNCITRSRYFTEAWTAGRITATGASLTEGYFEYPSKD